ncbi:hypothetical protein E5F05_14310 [Deinococcus metallilatus]|uniref:Lipoprotein n=1 Tax=Deinococcus metallilatus TaxID=1211322 RepID=A0AAJ5F6Y4_9DEIO|nr:hypothetical protein [Deinococcus metallilatus]MBB5294242.1 hypothetical protein [Deinococcus metallilatus]QBY09018.1 hypothetical protein E5F05_14310 [Deinococcus metallilatus]RXJ10162.1 hypothetical protein ERJ73_13140 [Deinococcus metallilatus]TLK27901.1 hypothetical protein FCS05_08240 [Deinococcus metallilatus]GMA16421.1 hypothetical protein GCM10025871_27520 [Deinococcus metallilatus]
MNHPPRVLLFAGAALALTACGGSSPPQASDQPPVTVINGKVVTWSGAGTVGVPELATVSTPVSADGTFTLTLPGEAALTGQTMTASGVMAALNCSGSLTSSAVGTRGFLVAALTARDASGARQVSAVEGAKTGLLSRSVHARVWLYADGATQLRGTVNCAKLLNISQISDLPVTVAVNTQRGWNVVDLSIEASANVFGQVSAAGTAVNSAAGSAQTTWRTMAELQAQIAF